MCLTINHLPLNSMAFADDLILLSNDAWQMNELMKICEIFFDSKSLRVNAKKCMSLRTLPVKGKNSMTVVNAPHRWWIEVPMPSMSFGSLSKYLGVMIDPGGGVILPMEKWTN